MLSYTEISIFIFTQIFRVSLKTYFKLSLNNLKYIEYIWIYVIRAINEKYYISNR